MKRYNTGRLQDMLNAVEDRITELSGNEIESSTDVMGGNNNPLSDYKLICEIVDKYMAVHIPDLCENFCGSELSNYTYGQVDKLRKACVSFYDTLLDVFNEDKDIPIEEFDPREWGENLSRTEEGLRAECKRVLSEAGFDINAPEVIDYAEAAAELMMNDDNAENAKATVAEWWKETKANYSYELDLLPRA